MVRITEVRRNRDSYVRMKAKCIDYCIEVMEMLINARFAGLQAY